MKKLILKKVELNSYKPKTFFFKRKLVGTEEVYKVVKAINYRAKEYYYPNDLYLLMDIGVRIEIKQ